MERPLAKNSQSIITVLILAVPLLMFAPWWGQFAFPPNSKYSDLLISHYPNILFIQQTLFNGGGLPLWTDSILSGYPFSASPISGLWYPPGWLLLFLPLPFGFNFLVFLHLLWGSIGMTRFLQAQKLHDFATIAGGLIFGLMPKIWAHFAAGHLTLIFAISWTPWLLLAEYNLVNRQRGKLPSYLSGIILGLIILADVRWAIYSGLLWLLYSLNEHFQKQQWLTRIYLKDFSGLLIKLKEWLFTKAIDVMAGIFLAAPLLLPLIEFTTRSTRNTLSSSDFFTLSLPPSHLLGFIIPDFAGYFEWLVYPGIVTFLLFIWVLGGKKTSRQFCFWILLFFTTLVFSLGNNIPNPFYLLSKVPGLSLLRVPSRSLFVAGISLAVLAAVGIDDLFSYQNEGKNLFGKFRLMFFITVTGLIIFLSMGLYYLTGTIPIGFSWAGAILIFGVTIITIRIRTNLNKNIWFLSSLFFFVLDLATIDYSEIRFRDSKDVFSEGQQTADYIKAQSGLFRVYSPSYSIPQQTSQRNLLQLADGIDPMQLSSYVRFMETASGVPYKGYGVTLPAFVSGNPDVDNISYTPDPVKLGYLNIRYIVSEYGLSSDSLILKARFGSTRVYENEKVYPRAWVQSSTQEVNSIYSNVSNFVFNPNEINLKAQGPGILVLSEVNYPGWIAYINQNQAPIIEVAGLLRGVKLLPGDNMVKLEYRPWPVFLGCFLAGSIILKLMYSFFRHRKI